MSRSRRRAAQHTGPVEPLRLCLAGCALDSGNRGVEALGRSVLSAVERHARSSSVTLLDNGWGVRALDAAQYPALQISLAGARRSRRLHRQESWARIGLDQRLGSWTNPVARTIRRAHAVLDISGGDSFTDLYGRHRFEQTTAPKSAALRVGTPLVLLPQTYGPFRDVTLRRRARALVLGAAMAFARDDDGFTALVALAGPAADPRRLRRGVDVAFALPEQDPGDAIGDGLRRALAGGRPAGPLVGINVSGLLWRGGQVDHDMALDYPSTVVSTLARLSRAGARFVLVPHVAPTTASAESDSVALHELLRRLPPEVADSVAIAPANLNAMQLKWVIGRCDWFWGARMHATIAALSSGVPAAAIGYSDKTAGVFATCGVRDNVIDGRSVKTQEAVERLVELFEGRQSAATTVRATVPAVVARAHRQLADVLGELAPAHARSAAGRGA